MFVCLSHLNAWYPVSCFGGLTPPALHALTIWVREVIWECFFFCCKPWTLQAAARSDATDRCQRVGFPQKAGQRLQKNSSKVDKLGNESHAPQDAESADY